MKLTDLLTGQKISLQIAWGEQIIEFESHIISKAGDMLYVTPYMHNGSPLELNIEATSKVICNVIAITVDTKQRQSWKRVELLTIKSNERVMYSIVANRFNPTSVHDDRREHERIEINKRGYVIIPENGRQFGMTIHDISDIGISFIVDDSFFPVSNQVTISFGDTINGRDFSMRIYCLTVRSQKVEGGSLWGCRISGENRDFLLYSFLTRLASKRD